MTQGVVVRGALSILASSLALAVWFLTAPQVDSAAGLLGEYSLFLALSLCLVQVPWTIEQRRHRGTHRRDISDRLLGQLGYGVCSVDAVGTIRSVNQAVERALGYSMAELRGRNLHQTLHECSSATACPLAASMVTGTHGRPEEGVLRRKDGSLLVIGYMATPCFTRGHIDGVVLAFHDASEHHRALSALRDGVTLYREIVLASPDPVVVTDLYGYVILANTRSAAMLGYPSPDVLLDAQALDFVAPADRARAIHDKERVIGGEEVEKVEYRWVRADGGECPVEVSMKLIRDEKGVPRGVVQRARDLRELKRVEATIQAGEARLAMQDAMARVLAETPRLERALPTLLQALCRWGGWEVGVFWKPDPDSDSFRCQELWHADNTAVHRFESLSRDQPVVVRGDPLFQTWEGRAPLWLPDAREAAPSARLMAAVQDGLHAALWVPVQGVDRVCGLVELFSTSIRPQDPDLMRAVVAAAAQIGQFIERKEAEAALEHQAMHDSLTGLANRTLFHGRLQHAIARAERYAWPVALLLMDLDGFKEVNDTLGHHAGDELLQQLAQRLQALFRHSDTVSRMGGDEFALVLPGTGDTGAAEAADKILSELCQPFYLDGLTVDIGTSIGIALYPRDGDDAHSLLRRADVAMYAAKRAGCGYLQSGDEASPGQPSPLAI